MKKNLAMIAIAAAAALGSIGAQAADGVYVGVNHNSTKLSCDDCAGTTQNGLGLYGGYRMGDISAEVSRFQKTVDGEKGVFTDFSVIPRMAVTKDVDLLGKVGIRHSSLNANDGVTYSGNSLVIGAGAEFNITPMLAARAMVDYSTKTFGEDIKNVTTTMGLSYKF